MSEPAIRVQEIGKRYRLGQRFEPSYKTLRDSLARPFRAGSRFRNSHGHIWALRDVAFEVNAGEVVGIVGRNGSGKSTLLKILSRITEPTEGEAQIHGRVGSLLEVGTGFHPELTGRENIFLNGAILGMKRAEIQRNFDEIVAFSEVEQFIDTAVKHYSSGMYLRLAFAVAAHLEPEILLVDEVLAVGDAAFQKKCMGKMNDVARRGRTVLFVSHNMGAVTRLCSRAVWLDGGRVRSEGTAEQVIASYLREGISSQAERVWAEDARPGDDVARLCAVRVMQEGALCSALEITKPFEIEVEFEVKRAVQEVAIGMIVLSSAGEPVLHSSDLLSGTHTLCSPARWVSRCSFPADALNSGQYYVTVGADIPHTRQCFLVDSALSWSVENVCPVMSRYPGWKGVVGPRLVSWTRERAGASS
jgi:lipopolysaccharide transport system ATP-binding protein